MRLHSDVPRAIGYPDKVMRTIPTAQKKSASIVKKKPASGMRKKCTYAVRQNRIHEDLMSCRTNRYDVNTKAIKDASGVVNFERVP